MMKLLFCVILLLPILMIPVLSQGSETAPPLPKNASDWLDGKPVQWESLKGKVVLLNVWTFGCWNSYRSLPWVVALQQKYPALQIIGVHTPEFDYEKDRQRLRQEMTQYGVTYPQILDDDFGYWRRLNNRYWPSFYLVDKAGNIRAKFVGETHSGDRQAKQIENRIAELMKENY